MSTDNFSAIRYRSGVAMVIADAQGQLFSACRIDCDNAWQFPQGGIQQGETALAAMYRELAEEVGLKPEHVKVIAQSKTCFSYLLPERVGSQYRGQTQRWFLLRLIADDSCINLQASGNPEFSEWRWVDYWQPLTTIVSFKRDVYQSVLNEFSGYL